MLLHIQEIPVTFGDCDPAGIVFYPRFFGWFDSCFHDWLRTRSLGHRGICERLGARGIGLMDARASFLGPVSDGDRLRITLAAAEWRKRSLHLNYTGHVADRLVLEGIEVRGLFLMDQGRLKAGTMETLKGMLER